MNKFLLFLVMLPSAIWKALGADTLQLRAILGTRLMLDDRKPLSMGRNQRQKKDRKHGTLVSSIILSFMGFFYMFPVLVVKDRIYSLTIYFSMLLGVVTFMLITDFSNVLFDSRDKYILFPRPVSDRTLVLARMLHVFIYLFRIVVPLSLAGWVTLGLMDGWLSALLFVLPLILLVFIALFLVNSVFLSVLRLAKPEKFKDVINVFQVITSVVFFASVYLIPTLFKKEDIGQFRITDHAWLAYTPTYWLAACWSWVGAPVNLAGTGVYSALAIAVPLLLMFIMVRWLAPQFTQRISGIDTVESGPVAVVARSSSGRFYQKLAAMFNSTSDARAGFMLAWLQTSRSRSFRMRVYPSFAFVPIYFIYILTRNNRSLSEAYAGLPESNMQLVLLYMSSFVMVNALNYLTLSEQYKAAWIYYSTPVETPGRIMVGALKALYVRYFLPFYLVISGFVVFKWGIATISDILLALCNITFFISCIALINFRHLPFSMMEQMKQRGARIMKSFLTMLIPTTLGFAHYAALSILWLKLLFMVLSAIALWLVWDGYATTSWEKVIRSEIE